MFDLIRMFLLEHWYFIVPVLTLCFLAIPVVVYWNEVRYWLMNLHIRQPIFGRIRHWVKHPGQIDEGTGFLSSEMELCSFYQKYYEDHIVETDFFKKCQKYLAKMNEGGRKEKGLGLWVLIIILMLIEATAFGYALAPFAMTLATPNTALFGAFAIGLVLSIIGLILSELAGRALYLNSIVDHIMSFEEVRPGSADGDMKSTRKIIIDNTDDDDELPEYQQILNRVTVPKNGSKPSKRFAVIIGYGIFIIGLAIAAFWVRTETLNAQEADLIDNPPAVVQSADDFPAAKGDIPFTEDMDRIGQEAAGKSAQDQIDALHRASLVTFAVLSGLFIFIQASSTYLAFMFGFAGTHSHTAWQKTHKFASADEFKRYNDGKARSIAVDAQASLGLLQAAQSKVFHMAGRDKEKIEKDRTSRTFDQFLKEMEKIKMRDDHEKDQRDLVKRLRKKREEAIEGGNSIEADRLKKVLDTLGAQATPAVQEQKPLSSPSVELAVGAVDATETLAVTEAQTPMAAPAKPAFNFNAYGDLTCYEEEDLDVVADTLKLDVALVRRAYGLQKLKKSTKDT